MSLLRAVGPFLSLALTGGCRYTGKVQHGGLCVPLRGRTSQAHTELLSHFSSLQALIDGSDNAISASFTAATAYMFHSFLRPLTIIFI